MYTIPFLLPRVAEDLKANWQTAKNSSLADIAGTKTLTMLSVSPLNSNMVRKVRRKSVQCSESILVITASERRSLNGDDHLSNCHENVAFAI